MKIYSIGQQGTESLGCGNANESHCKTLFGLPAQLNSQLKGISNPKVSTGRGKDLDTLF
jgi:hypothetical protein